MDFMDFIVDMLGITSDFGITKIDKDEVNKTITIELKYTANQVVVSGHACRIYDYAASRRWQHLDWFEYRCFLECQLPRYIDEQGSPKVMTPQFAPKGVSFTHGLARRIIEVLQRTRCHSETARLLRTSAYIVRTVQDTVVSQALKDRPSAVHTDVSIDEKAFKKGHHYASILVDAKSSTVIDMVDGRKIEDVKPLFYNDSELKPEFASISRVRMDMWAAFMNIFKQIAPLACIVHDKFHLFAKLSTAIDLTRRHEVKKQAELKGQRYTFLRNASTRSETQEKIFTELEASNLKTAQAWHIRENFKSVFNEGKGNEDLAHRLFDGWVVSARQKNLRNVNTVIKTFESHREGVINAIVTGATNAGHESLNSRIQSVISRARGFRNFERFKTATLFHFGGLQLTWNA